MSKNNAQNRKDIEYMQIALNLAKKQLGNTAPNPSVGCVIVKDDNIIAKGVTGQNGSPHGEVDAINKCNYKDLLEGATAYVTLEPCCHYGKNPPCTDALIKAKIKRVVIATIDPFAKVAGGGIKKLQEANIEVDTDICKEEAVEINKGFFKVCSDNKPLVILKLATSLDSKIATFTNDSKWITNDKARKYSHSLRANCDAIMVGNGTVKHDNPSLTCRLEGYENYSLTRVVISSDGKIKQDSNLLKTASDNNKLWIFQSHNQNVLYNNEHVEVINCKNQDNNKVDLKLVLETLAKKGVTRLLVEGGGTIAASLINQNLVDELHLIKAPIIIGGDGVDAIAQMGISSINSSKKLTLLESKKFDDNILEIYQFKASL